MTRILNNAEKFKAGVAFGCEAPTAKPIGQTRPRWSSEPSPIRDSGAASVSPPSKAKSPIRYTIKPGTAVVVREIGLTEWERYTTEDTLTFTKVMRLDQHFMFTYMGTYIRASVEDVAVD